MINAVNPFITPPERSRTILADESGSVAYPPEAWEKVTDAVAFSVADANKREKPVAVIGFSDILAPRKAAFEPVSAAEMKQRMSRPMCGSSDLATALETGVEVASVTGGSGGRVIAITDGCSNSTEQVLKQAEAAGVSIGAVAVGSSPEPALQIFDNVAWAPHPAAMKAAISVFHPDSRPQTDALACAGLDSISAIAPSGVAPALTGEVFLRAITIHGDNQERMVAAVGSKAAAAASSPYEAILTRYLALTGLANGAHGPIGMVLGHFGSALMQQPAGISMQAPNSILNSIAKKSKNEAEVAVARTAADTFMPSAHRIAFDSFANQQVQGAPDKALAQFGLKVLTEAAPDSARVINDAILQAIKDRSANDPTQASFVDAAIKVAAKKDTADALGVQAEAFAAVLSR